MYKGALYRVGVSAARFFSQPRGGSDIIPVPVDAPQVHVSGPDADRILFFGSGAIAGIGVDSHRSSIVGHASRKISAFTHRGVDADVFAEEDISIRSVPEALDSVRLARYDAIVIAVGFNDLLLRTSKKRWALGVAEMLERVEAGTLPSTSIFLMGVGDPSGSPLLRPRFRSEASRRARAFNKCSRRIIAKMSTVTFLPFDPGPMNGDRPFTSIVHAEWASQIARPIASALDRDFYSGSDRPGYALDPEPDRQAALDRLGILDTAPEERFDRIVKMAKTLLRTEAAAFSLIDRDRQWLKSSVGIDLGETERTASMCNTTITQRGGLEVDDALLDPRFADLSSVADEPNIRFYLGYPIETVEGFPIGALCVFDPEPRHPADNSMNVLRDLALLIQNELVH